MNKPWFIDMGLTLGTILGMSTNRDSEKMPEDGKVKKMGHLTIRIGS
jgi:hypothetical protein